MQETGQTQWGSGNWEPKISLPEGLGGAEAKDWTAEATAVTLLGSKAALHKTNAGDRESREGSEGLPLPTEQELSNLKTEA